ncbi:SDR family NAD(P)-dependent oxidoreductase [Amycolatopsis taiwanensis]|uniref:SDR family NAD(P)-dependent oxidoreductase n=1 Tax=Amycolatopsis taiwanensis TaxID=342230 RepID=UPI001FE0B6E7|nr:SDR family NAD(P)-dependent oxidoreductase [Amycolatopsis taiwanensis]
MTERTESAMDSRRYGPWAVITGGSEGVGAAFARLLAEAGLNLVLIARKRDPLAATAAECRAHGVQVRTLATDLTEPGAIGRVVDATADIEVGLLIHNAGANSHSRPFLDGDLTAFQRVIDLNVAVPMALVHHFGQSMRDRRRGGILLAGSLSGNHGAMRQSVYGGAKAFVQIFAESLWVELREHGVDVLALVLGATRTPAMARAGLNFDVPGLVVSEPEEVAREGLAHLPHGPVRIVSGHEVQAASAADADRAKVVLEAHDRVRQLLNG